MAGDPLKAGAVSETIGAVVLISVAAIAVGIIALVFFSSPLPTNIPAFSGLISNTSNRVYISHEGGDSLYVGQFQILADYGGKMGVDETANFTKSLPSNVFSLGMRMNATLPANVTHIVMIYNTTWGGGNVLLEADLQGVIPLSPPGWYSPYWLYRKKIIIDHTKVAGSLTGFPVLINRADVQVGNEAQQPSGNDILFTAWDGTTKLPHELESYNWNGGTMVVWVKVPALSPTTDTVIYMYYGNSNAPNQQNPTAVWSPDYTGVWHLNASFSDSTSNGNGGTNNATTDVGGQIGAGRSFSNGNSVTIADAGSLDMTAGQDFTMSAWVKTSQAAVAGTWPALFRKVNDPTRTEGYGLYLHNQNLNGGHWYFELEDGPYYGAYGLNNIADGTWHYVVGVRAGSTVNAYEDGTPGDSIPGSAGDLSNGNTLTMGANSMSPPDTLFYAGSLDELRIAKTARPLSWIKTEYNNQKNPGIGGFLVSVSNEQTPLSMT
ncbi:MAG TPA: DUF2341 domain-containing protein [Methanomicrobiales archaeon]|nr:DUF2341 domain-containing protein [Methanomicrobiales archaeon]